ncbi:AEC family transporter [Ruegeria sp. 2205SS24-7]|uniref:AEC family transporter n=1 Tax=Ruegeria discodermiae TaxID=3064389 RepID=UPI002742917A|nr:AEC family transporter [Ruegeria sp. 2205SS24-7]MDP5215676.1 AEC family transporter [Ruegeria sp. 2205SS24-7]
MLNTLGTVILPVFLVIGAGYVATGVGYIKQAHNDALMRFATGFAIPCLLFHAIATLDLQSSFNPNLMVSFYMAAALCFTAGFLGARILFQRPWEDCVAIGFCCLFSNSLMLGIPITERAYGPEGLAGNYAIVSIHAPFCYGLGITVMEVIRNRGNGGRKTVTAVLRAMFRNALIIAIGLGFAFNFTGISMPDVAEDALQLIIRAALPVALFAMGGVLVQYRPEGDMRTIALVCAISLLLHPALVWSFGTALSLPQDLFRSGVLTAAMAPGINAYIFADLYGRAKRVAASSVLLATGASVLSIWMWLTLLG